MRRRPTTDTQQVPMPSNGTGRPSTVMTGNTVNRMSTATTTAAWNWLRYVLVAVLVGSAIAVAVLVYAYTSNIEYNEFEAQLESDADKILKQVGHNFLSTMAAADDFMMRVIRQARVEEGTWPMITIPGLAVQAAKLIAQTNSIYMTFYPLIQASERLTWENFTRYNDEWVEEALEVQSTNPNFFGPILTNFSKSHVIWNNEGPVAANASGPFLPSWMGSPVIPFYYPYNWNALAYPAFASGLRFVLEHKQVVITPVANHANPNDPVAISQAAVTSDWAIPYLEPGEDTNEPFSDMYYPVLDNIDSVVIDTSLNNNSALGAVAFSFYWRHALKDILPAQSKGLLLVVSNPCEGEQQFTYRIDGSRPIFLGYGDLHETELNHHARSSHLANFSNSNTTSYTGVSMSDVFCPYTLSVYPSSEMKNEYVTKTPIALAIGSSLIFIFVTALFCAYDFLIRKEFHSKQRLLELKRHLLRFVRLEVQRPLSHVCQELSMLENNMAEGAHTQRYANYLLDDEYVTQRTQALEHEARNHLEGWLDLTREICDTAGSSVDLLNDLLNYDQIQTEALVLDWNVLGAWELLRQVVQEFLHLASRNNVQLQLEEHISKEGDPGSLLDFQIVGDKVKLTQLLRNLISNAIKMSPEDERVTIRASYDMVQKPSMDQFSLQCGKEVSFLRHGTLVIQVIDAGVGMTEQEVKCLFTKGAKLNMDELEAGKGSSLGLYISKGMAKHHRGDLQVSSEGPGKGSVFVLQLPLYHMSATRAYHFRDTLTRNAHNTNASNNSSSNIQYTYDYD